MHLADNMLSINLYIYSIFSKNRQLVECVARITVVSNSVSRVFVPWAAIYDDAEYGLPFTFQMAYHNNQEKVHGEIKFILCRRYFRRKIKAVQSAQPITDQSSPHCRTQLCPLLYWLNRTNVLSICVGFLVRLHEPIRTDSDNLFISLFPSNISQTFGK